MENTSIHIGAVVSGWLIKQELEQNYKGTDQTLWLCVDKSHNYAVRTTAQLKRRESLEHSEPIVDGQRFGRLTVIERCESIKGRKAYLCQCDCGNTTKAIGTSLRNGRTTSCGCARGHRTNFPNRNLEGQKFGRLTVIKEGTKDKGGHFRYLCQCDCGNTIEARPILLLNGRIKSCGCKRAGIKLDAETLDNLDI